MSTVTPKLGLVKPAGLEQFSRATYNNNLDILDAAAVQMDTAVSTANWTNFSFLQSTFTRVRIGTKGFVVAHIQGLVDTAHSVPANTATGNNYGNVVPAGYRPKRLVSYHMAVASAAGRGDNVQTAIDTLGDWYIRSNTASTFAMTFASIVHDIFVYEWDGVV